MAIASLALRLRPETSRLGVGITVAALIVMPILARLKSREARRSNNAALAADAVQSAACAYLAVIALAGLVINALFHIAWFDSLAALAAVTVAPEGRSCSVERASLRLLLRLTPWMQTDLLSNVVERVVGHRSVWRCGRHWLSSYSPFHRRANLSDLRRRTADSVHSVWDRGVHELHCSPQSQAD